MVYLDKGLKIKKGYMLGRRKNVPVVMPPTVMHPSEYFFQEIVFALHCLFRICIDICFFKVGPFTCICT